MHRRTWVLHVNVAIIGRGQVGRALATALRAKAISCRSYPFRRGLPARLDAYDIVLLCVRDGQLPEATRRLSVARLSPRSVVAHVAGALGPDVLTPLKTKCSGIAQMHPYASILGSAKLRSFRGVPFLLTGDRRAIPVLRRLIRALGATAFTADAMDRTKYHLSAALLANGTVTLFRLAEQVLEDAGVDARWHAKLLLSLLDSVRFNLARVGSTAALTGPIRRGDAATVERHLAVLERRNSALSAVYRGLGLAQLDIAAELHELSPKQRRVIRALLEERRACV
ncbi:MAG: DUF2520 domain-containing protein [Polyangiaceae bacterium]